MLNRRDLILATGGLLLTLPLSAQTPTTSTDTTTTVAAESEPVRNTLPRDPALLANLARFELRRGNERQAAGFFAAALAFGGLSHQDATRYAWLLATSRDPSTRAPLVAIRIAQAELDAHPECRDSQLFAALAVSYAGIGNQAAAESWMAKVVESPEAARRPDIVVAVNELVSASLARHSRRTRATAETE